MAELRCGAEQCSYNSDHLCCKGDIMVGETGFGELKNVNCDSFREKGENDQFRSSLDHPCETIRIDCEANQCIFNSNYKCVAKRVDITSLGSSSAKCATYQATCK